MKPIIILLLVGLSSSSVNICEMDQECFGPIGKIISPEGANSEFEYIIKSRSREKEAIYFMFFEEDLEIDTNSKCYVHIGEDLIEIDGSSDLTFQDDTDCIITAQTIASGCSWSFWYFTYPNEITNQSFTLTDDKGSFEAPKEVDEPLFQTLFGYKFNTRALWTIIISDPRASIHLNITLFDLGSNAMFLNDINCLNEILRDHLIIGSGETVLNGSDYLLYGHSDNLQLYIPSNVAHIFFVSDVHHEEAMGFEIHYEAIIEQLPNTTTTSTPATTVMQSPDHIWASIDGVSPNEGLETTENSFKGVIAKLALLYGEQQAIHYLKPITAEDVIVFNRKTCLKHFCSTNCVSFSYNINVKNTNGDWALNSKDLRELLTVDKNQWHDLGPDVQVCDEHPTFNVGWVAGVLASVLFLVVVIGVISWKFVSRDDKEDKKHLLDLMISDEVEVNRRVSISSTDTRKVSMPFPRSKMNKQDDTEEQFDDLDDYVEYEPDNNIRNYHALGIEKELYGINRMNKAYINPSFDNDEEDNISNNSSKNGDQKLNNQDHFFPKRQRNPSFLAESDEDNDDISKTFELQKQGSVFSADIHASEEGETRF